MNFTKETIDISGLKNEEIKEKLSDLNIPLTPEEAKKIQNEMLGRAPSLAELILFSIPSVLESFFNSSSKSPFPIITSFQDEFSLENSAKASRRISRPF